ncbi:hypothetical protein CDV36_008227 [Fusarium kuroshium]|uniref:Uncharacterized protein n=1 Tax=Fusarium kuroshium TaxID=2010991 RepID=A0A3M2S4C4_9HYPO|nr:hypothetical protein CDV36_008227 [Fusarium kuroshium]
MEGSALDEMRDSYIYDLKSDKVDRERRSSSAEEAADEKQPEMDERPNLVLNSACPARVQVVQAQSSFSRCESRNSTMPKESWQDTSGNTLEDLEWREDRKEKEKEKKKEKEKEKEELQDDAIYSEAYTSTDPESSSSMFGDEDSDTVLGFDTVMY